jgi:hypothetical protein
MARRNEIAAIYLAGVVQGIALVTFPAIGIIFTSAAHYDLSNAQYGGMFLPQAIMAVAASLLGAGLGSEWVGREPVFVRPHCQPPGHTASDWSQVFMPNTP